MLTLIIENFWLQAYTTYTIHFINEYSEKGGLSEEKSVNMWFNEIGRPYYFRTSVL